MAVVTINSETVLDTDDIDNWEAELSTVPASITSKVGSVQRFILTELRAAGMEESEVNDPTELEELAACRLLYMYFRDQAAIIEDEGFSSKMAEYKDECEAEIDRLFTRGGLTHDAGELQARPTKLIMKQIG